MLKLGCRTYQKVVLPTMILTVPGNLVFLVKVSSSSIASSGSSVLSSETASSDSYSCSTQGGEPDERKIPAAAACVSVGELRDAIGLLGPRELRAMRMCEGFVDSVVHSPHSTHYLFSSLLPPL